MEISEAGLPWPRQEAPRPASSGDANVRLLTQEEHSPASVTLRHSCVKDPRAPAVPGAQGSERKDLRSEEPGQLERNSRLPPSGGTAGSRASRTYLEPRGTWQPGISRSVC